MFANVRAMFHLPTFFFVYNCMLHTHIHFRNTAFCATVLVCRPTVDLTPLIIHTKLARTQIQKQGAY